MATSPVPPFAVPSHGSIDMGPWLMGDAREPLPPRLEEWDYATKVHLRRAVSLDTGRLRTECHLPVDAPLSLVVTAESTSTGIRRVVHHGGVMDGENWLAFTLRPTELGGMLTLTVQLVLAGVVRASVLAARRPGSVLWSDSQRVALEGNAARFPIEVISFLDAGLPGRAPWIVQIDPSDVDRPAPSAVRVLINSDHEQARGMAADPSATPSSRLLADSLEADIALRMLHTAIAVDEIDTSNEYPPGSIGESLSEFIRSMLPHRDLAGLRTMPLGRMGQVEAEVMAELGAFAR